MQDDDMGAAYGKAMDELTELGAMWFEAHVSGHDATHIADRITATDKLTRRLERKLRRRRRKGPADAVT